MKLTIAEALSTSLYAGYAPKAPGTAGAAVGVLLVWAIHHFFTLSDGMLLAIVLLLLWPSVWATDVLIAARGVKDPQCVVIDEVLGQMLVFYNANLANPWVYLLAFGLFRAFDIFKPWPVNAFEKLPGGWGVMMDDLMAGVYGALVLYALRHLAALPL